MPLLTICVPTYNREANLRQLLACFDRELADAEGVTVLISDNASPDGSGALLQDAAATRPWLQLHRQPENLGAVGNLQWLVTNSPDAEYLWCFGDDDLVLPGRLATVVAALAQERPAWLFLPHVFVDDTGQEVGRSPAPAALARFATPGALYQAYHHWLTFLTASIVRRDDFRAAVAIEETENAYIPLLWFFRAALDENGPCVVAAEHIVAGSNAISWADRAHDIMTLDFTSLWDDGLHRGLTEAEFGATLDGLYSGSWLLGHWQRQPIEELLRLVPRFPQSRGLRFFLWSIARRQERRDALPVLEAASRATGDEARALERVADGEAHVGQADWDAGEHRFAEATKLAPTVVAAWNDLAVTLHRRGHTEAADALEAALFVAPDDVDARLNRAEVRAARGDRDGAIVDLRHVLALEPGHEAASALLREL